MMRLACLIAGATMVSATEWPLLESRARAAGTVNHGEASRKSQNGKCDPGNVSLSTPTGNVRYFGFWAGSDGHGVGLAHSNVYFDMSWIPGTFLHPTSPLWKEQCGNGKLKCMPRLDDYWDNFTLAPNYKEKWAAAAPTWVKYQREGRLLGFLMGDELQRRGASRQ